MQVLFMDNQVGDIVGCKPNEIKVLLGMVRLARHNVVDLYRKHGKLLDLVDLGEKSVETALTGLCKKGMIVKTGVAKVWYIDPSYFMKGYYEKIYAIGKMLEEKDNRWLEKVDEWDEEERSKLEEKKLQGMWGSMRISQADIEKQMALVDGYTDSLKVDGVTIL